MKNILVLFFLIATTTAVSAQRKYSEKEMSEMMGAYGFYLGQLTSANSLIKVHPSLSPAADKALNKWNLNYLSSIENITTELTAIYGNKFVEFKKQMKAKMSETDYSSVSIDDAKFAIQSIQDRANGNIPSPIIETLLSYNPIYQKNPDKEMINGFVKEYFTKESIKSKGVNIKLKYPKSWLAENGNRPHVIQKFTSNYGHGSTLALIMLTKPKEPLSQTDIDILLSEEGMKSQIPENSKIISVNPNLTMDNFPAASITFYHVQSQMNLKFGMMTTFYIIYYKGCQISLMLTASSEQDNFDEAKNKYLTNKKLFWRIANNLTILSQYE
jgi:hypothetical protein